MYVPTFFQQNSVLFHLFRYNIVLSCWERNPDLRPFFTDLVREFTAALSNMADYFDLIVSRPSSSMAVTVEVTGNSHADGNTLRVLDNGIHSQRVSVTSF